MILELEETKAFLKVDFDDEDILIESLILAAQLYLKNATGIIFDNTNPLAVLYCKVLVYEWYKDKSLMEDSKVSERVKFTLQSILLQLQFSGPIQSQINEGNESFEDRYR